MRKTSLAALTAIIVLSLGTLSFGQNSFADFLSRNITQNFAGVGVWNDSPITESKITEDESSLVNVPVSQNFDSIGTTATAGLPTEFKVSKSATERTVGTYATATSATEQVGGANLSSTAANGVYNFGAGTTTTGSDRAIGFVSSASATKSGNLYALLNNNSGSGYTGLRISYNVEKYRTGTNAAGYTIQLYYSTDGSTWTSAGSNFTTSFAADTTTAGYATAPGVTVAVTNQTLNQTIANGGTFYLAWNYSVTSGAVTSNAQALAIDDISITGISAPVNNPPTITAATGVSVVKGTTTTGVQVATVTDDGGAGNVVVTVVQPDSSNNVTISNIQNTNGVITADITAACSAANASFTLSATDGVNTAQTATVNVGVTDSTTAAQLTFGQQPTNTVSGTAISPAVTVNAANACGVLVSGYTGAVTIALNGGGTASGTTTVNAVNGTATFSNLIVSGPAGAYTLTASASGLTSANSSSFNITAPTIVVSPASLPNGTTGTAYTQTITASGGTAPYSFSSTGTLPNGLTLTTGGTLSGTPTTAGTFNFTVIATDTAGYTGSRAYTVTINQGATAGVTVTPTSVNVTEGGATANYSLVLNSQPTADVTINISTANQQPTFGNSPQVTVNPTSVTFTPANYNVPQTVTVTAVDDSQIEGTHTATITHTASSTDANYNGIGVASVGVTITDNDVNPTVQFGAASSMQDESQTAQIAVVRTGNLSVGSSVTYTVSDGTATGGTSCTGTSDYASATSGTINFGVNETSQLISIPLCADTLVENTETVNLTLTGATNATLGTTTTHVLSINDTAAQFENTTAINIGSQGTPYPAPINVTGAPAQLTGIRVTLYDVQYTGADALDVLLVGPQGQKFILMADAGGSATTAGATLTFSDDAGQVLPDSTPLTTGKYEPTSWEAGQSSFPAPAPAAPYLEPGSAVGGTPSFASTFGNTNANGTWNLYIRNDGVAFAPVGGGGTVQGGWGLQLLGTSASPASISGRVSASMTGIGGVRIMLTGTATGDRKLAITNSFGNYSFGDLNTGETYVLTVVSSRYYFANPSQVVNLQDNVTGVNFTAEQ